VQDSRVLINDGVWDSACEALALTRFAQFPFLVGFRVQATQEVDVQDKW